MEEYRNILGGFGVSGELATRPVISLSGGQKSRLAFAQMAMIKYALSFKGFFFNTKMIVVKRFMPFRYDISCYFAFVLQTKLHDI